MSEVINHILGEKEAREMRVASEEEAFREDAISRFSECLAKGGDLHETIEEISADYWDIFYRDLEKTDINLYVIQATSYLIRTAS